MRKQHSNIYTDPGQVDNQWEFAVRLRELRLGLSGNLEGWDGVGGGRDAQE